MKNPRTPYLITISSIIICTMMGIVLLMVLRPSPENAVVIAGILGMLAPTITGILAMMKSEEAVVMVAGVAVQGAEHGAAIEGVRKDVDGKMAQLLKASTRAATAEAMATAAQDALEKSEKREGAVKVDLDRSHAEANPPQEPMLLEEVVDPDKRSKLR